MVDPTLQDAFRALYDTSIAAQTAAAEADLRAIRAELARLSRRLVTLDRRLPANARRVEALRALPSPAAAADAELERLLAVPGVHAVAVDGSVVRVRTTPLRITWEGATHELGE